MSKRLVSVLMSVVLLLGLGGIASATSMIDDFDSYVDTADLGSTWWVNWSMGGGTVTPTLNVGGGDASTNAMSVAVTGVNSISGAWMKRQVVPGVSAPLSTGLHVWNKLASVGGSTVPDDVVWRASVKTTGGPAGNDGYWDTGRTVSNLPNGSSALSMTGLFGGGLAGGLIDLPWTGGGSGADVWEWVPKSGQTVSLASEIAGGATIDRVQILGFSYSSGPADSFEILTDSIGLIPEPSSLLLGSFGLALCGGLRRRR